MRRPWPALGCRATERKKLLQLIYEHWDGLDTAGMTTVSVRNVVDLHLKFNKCWGFMIGYVLSVSVYWLVQERYYFGPVFVKNWIREWTACLLQSTLQCKKMQAHDVVQCSCNVWLLNARRFNPSLWHLTSIYFHWGLTTLTILIPCTKLFLQTSELRTISFPIRILICSAVLQNWSQNVVAGSCGRKMRNWLSGWMYFFGLLQ